MHYFARAQPRPPKPLVHVRRGLHVAEGEALLASAEAGVRVFEAPSGVVRVSAAPGGEVCAVDAGGLDEACR